MDKSTYYSPEDIAKHFNVKPDSVRKWIREGKLKAIKLGRIWRIPEVALQEFIEESMAKGKGEGQ